MEITQKLPMEYQRKLLALDIDDDALIYAVDEHPGDDFLSPCYHFYSISPRFSTYEKATIAYARCLDDLYGAIDALYYSRIATPLNEMFAFHPQMYFNPDKLLAHVNPRCVKVYANYNGSF